MPSPVGLLGILIVFGAIIFFHELGHFIVAKISRMAVYEFSLGFGPAIFSKEYHGTLYAIRIMPLGGFVRIAGMEPDEDPNIPNGFNEKSFLAKYSTILAGVFMNFVLAFLVITVLGMTIGYRTPGNKTIIAGVMPNAPAQQAGIQPGDIVTEIDGVRNPNLDQFLGLVRTGPKPIHLVLQRDKQFITRDITPKMVDGLERPKHSLIYHVKKYPGIGVMPDGVSGNFERYNFTKSVTVGFTSVGSQIFEAFSQFLSVVSGSIPLRMLSGPVGIMQVSYNTSKGALHSLAGLSNFLSLIAFISVFVGFFNLLPIPALDGSRLFFLVIDGVMSIFGKRIDPQKEATVHMVGLFILLGFVLLITVKDIWTWVKG